jgi:hypothetical protein
VFDPSARLSCPIRSCSHPMVMDLLVVVVVVVHHHHYDYHLVVVVVLLEFGFLISPPFSFAVHIHGAAPKF